MLIIEFCRLEQQTQSRVHDLLSECNLQLSDVCSFTQAAISISGVIGGPLLGLFTIGILCPFANSKVSLYFFVFIVTRVTYADKNVDFWLPGLV